MSDTLTDDEVRRVWEAYVGAPHIFLYTADGERATITEGEVGSLAGEVLALRTMVEVATVDYRRLELILRDTQRRFAEAIAIAREALDLASGAWARNRDFTDLRARLDALTSFSDAPDPSDGSHRGDAPTSPP